MRQQTKILHVSAIAVGLLIKMEIFQGYNRSSQVSGSYSATSLLSPVINQLTIKPCIATIGQPGLVKKSAGMHIYIPSQLPPILKECKEFIIFQIFLLDGAFQILLTSSSCLTNNYLNNFFISIGFSVTKVLLIDPSFIFFFFNFSNTYIECISSYKILTLIGSFINVSGLLDFPINFQNEIIILEFR